jgi:RNase P protein component
MFTIYSSLSCLLRIIQRKRKEDEHTVFWFARGQKAAKTQLREGEARVEPDSLFSFPMLPRTKRLTGALVKEVVAKGKTLHSPILSVRILEESRFKGGFFAVIAPKKAASTAVLRNSLRRKGYSALRLVIAGKECAGAVLVFMKPEAASVPLSTIKEELSALLIKGKIFLNHKSK